MLLKDIFRQASKRRFRQFLLVQIFVVIKAVTELLVVAAIALFLSILTDPLAVVDNSTIVVLDRTFSLGLTDMNHKNLVMICAILLIFVVVLKAILTLSGEYLRIRFSHRLAGEISAKLFDGMLHADYEWLLLNKRTDLIKNLEWRAELEAYLEAILSAISEGMVTFLLCLLVVIATPLDGLIFLGLTGLLTSMVFRSVGRKIDRAAIDRTKIRLEVFGIIRITLNGIKDVFISKSKSLFWRNFHNKIGREVKIAAMLRLLARVPAAMLETLGFVFLGGGVMIILAFTPTAIETILTTVYLFAVIAWRILPATNRVITNIATLKGSAPPVRSILNLLEGVIKHPHAGMAQVKGSQIQSITQFSLQNISYTYRNKAKSALQNITFSVSKGEKLGVIGSSGAGKSTLVDIMVGLLPPEKGVLSINDMATNQIDHASWAKQIGYVAQAPFFFEGTIAENIAFGQHSTDFNYEKLQQVSTQAAMDFMTGLEGDIHAPLGERGFQLSGGQIQRIAIARALYRNPSMIIFDEATSALDSKTEGAIMDTIYNLDDDIVIVIIAHRLTSLDRCTKILWLEEGSVRGFGRPEEVLPQFQAFSSQRIAD